MSVPGPLLGPCEAWIDGDAVAACCSAAAGSEGASAFDEVATVASMLAFELSGRQFTGLCEKTVRPCAQSCGCFGVSRSGAWTWDPFSASYGWRDDCGNRCGCGSLSQVKLSGYPVREIVEVTIDGAVVDPESYRLDEWRWLTRLDDPGPPPRSRVWPACQNLALNDDQPGTFAVSYRCGVDPPQLGRDAAAALACELHKACTTGKCALPSKVTKVVRQGVTIERVTSLADMLRAGSTGLQLLDAFIAGYNSTKMARRPAVWSPDVQQAAKQVG